MIYFLSPSLLPFLIQLTYSSWTLPRNSSGDSAISWSYSDLRTVISWTDNTRNLHLLWPPQAIQISSFQLANSWTLLQTCRIGNYLLSSDELVTQIALVSLAVSAQNPCHHVLHALHDYYSLEKKESAFFFC